MPREYLHWKVLEEATKQLEGTSKLAGFLEKYESASKLGAVAHDAPYYYGLGDKPFSEIASFLHGHFGGNTAVPLKNLAGYISKIEDDRNRNLLWAFLFGLLTHYVADIHFHPLVYYYTGDYYDPDSKKRHIARSYHRLFEVYLDSWFRVKQNDSFKEGFSPVIKDLSNDLDLICKLLESEWNAEKLLSGVPSFHGNIKEVSRGSWKASFSYLGFYLKLFYCDATGALIRFLNYFSCGVLKPIDTLFLFGRKKAISFLDNPLSVQNPITGTTSSLHVLEIYQSAISDCVTLGKILNQVIATNDINLFKFPDNLDGNSLNFGIKCGADDVPKYFSKTPWIE
jgi:Zinc dependent phospholipase C